MKVKYYFSKEIAKFTGYYFAGAKGLSKKIDCSKKYDAWKYKSLNNITRKPPEHFCMAASI